MSKLTKLFGKLRGRRKDGFAVTTASPSFDSYLKADIFTVVRLIKGFLGRCGSANSASVAKLKVAFCNGENVSEMEERLDRALKYLSDAGVIVGYGSEFVAWNGNFECTDCMEFGGSKVEGYAKVFVCNRTGQKWQWCTPPQRGKMCGSFVPNKLASLLNGGA